MFQFTIAARNAMLDAITTAVGIDAFIRIYDGVPPATPATALASNTLLAELSLDGAFAAGASGGVLTVNAITGEDAIQASGTASFWRVYKADGITCVIQGDCDTTNSDMNLSDVNLVMGDPLQITSFTMTAPGA